MGRELLSIQLLNLKCGYSFIFGRYILIDTKVYECVFVKKETVKYLDFLVELVCLYLHLAMKYMESCL